MLSRQYSVLAALALRILAVVAVADSPVADDAGSPPARSLKADFALTFPESDIFAVKLVNGRPTKAVVDITNNEAKPFQLMALGGALYSLKPLPADAPSSAGIIRNLSSVRYDATIPAGEKQSVPYSFILDLQPQELRLELTSVVVADDGEIFQVKIAEQTVEVVEAPFSFFDPRTIFLYLFLGAGLAGVSYFVYNTYLEPLLPQTKKTRAPRKAKVVTVEKEPVSGGEGAATGASYDESWIPQGHLNRPTGKRGKSGASAKTKVKSGTNK